MSQLIWSPAALADMQRLYRFQAEKDDNTAKRTIGKIRRSINILAWQPQIGRPVEEMPYQYRDWPIEFGNNGYLVRHQHEAGYWHQ